MAPFERLSPRLFAVLGLGALVPLAVFVLDRTTPVVAGALSATCVVLIVAGLWFMFGPAEREGAGGHGNGHDHEGQRDHDADHGSDAAGP